MSHFTVLVIGEEVEKQLAPFHEFECTGINDEFVVDVDVTAECVEHGIDWHGLEDRVVSCESEVDRNGKHQYGYAVMQGEKLIKAVNRTNPNAKWDWYQVGGRWAGMLKMKSCCVGETGTPGLMTSPAAAGYADSAFTREVDFNGMRDEAGSKAGAQHDLVVSVIGDFLSDFIDWTTMRETVHKGDIDAARNAYHKQEAVQALRGNDQIRFCSVEDFQSSRDDHVNKARNSAITTFAVIKDGKWYERGEMGWWACVGNEKDSDVWEKEFSSLIDSLSDDTRITVIDCHI